MWAVWAGVFFVVALLAELLRMSLLLVRGLKTQSRLEIASCPELTDPSPLVSIVIPAKDEAQNIERTVRSILDSDYRNFEILLVDDRSLDDTLPIMKCLARHDSRIKVSSVTCRPADWTGKTHALFNGTESASGDILVFTDADALWSSDVLSRSIGIFMSEDLDMLSLLPSFTRRGFAERVVYPHLALGLLSLYPLSDVNDRHRSAAIASGCFIMIAMKTYDALGTWMKFRKTITEDVAMSKAIKERGGTLRVMRAGSLIRTAPFGSIYSVCRFWRRTFYGCLGKSVSKIIRLFANYISLSLLCVIFVLSVLSVLRHGAGAPELILLVVSSTAMAAVIVPFSIFLKREGVNWLYGLTAPLGILLSAWVTLSTLVAVAFGTGIEWRGSVYK